MPPATAARINPVTQFLRLISSAKLTCVYLGYFMILLVFATLMQTKVGVFSATQKYLTSLFFFDAKIPLPGGGLIIILITLSLFTRTCLPSNLKSRARLGTNLLHTGLLVLLIGSILQHLTGFEGNMVLTEGSHSNIIREYSDVELAIGDSKVYHQSDFNNLEIKLDEAPFVITEFYQNSTLSEDQSALIELPLALLPSNNRAGISITRIEDGSTELIQEFDSPSNFFATRHQLTLRRVQRELPFHLHLLNFERITHPGTDVPSAFTSDVRVEEGLLQFQQTIAMNEPLRHGGYTFFQASFVEGADNDTSVLAVVKDRFRILPYVSSMIMALGLLWHLLKRVPMRLKQ